MYPFLRETWTWIESLVGKLDPARGKRLSVERQFIILRERLPVAIMGEREEDIKGEIRDLLGDPLGAFNLSILLSEVAQNHPHLKEYCLELAAWFGHYGVVTDQVEKVVSIELSNQVDAMLEALSRQANATGHALTRREETQVSFVVHGANRIHCGRETQVAGGPAFVHQIKVHDILIKVFRSHGSSRRSSNHVTS